MVGADETTELWRPPLSINLYSIQLKVKVIKFDHKTWSCKISWILLVSNANLIYFDKLIVHKHRYTYDIQIMENVAT